MTTERKKAGGNRKQITFDLSQSALKQYYPRPVKTLNPSFYKKAYSDISKFMKQNGFEHRQFSVYTSKEKFSEAKVIALIDDLAYQMPWLTHCVNQIDVTNIGSQHSLVQTLEAASTLQIEKTEPERSNLSPTQSVPLIQKSMADRMAEADRRNNDRSLETPTKKEPRR